MPRFSHKDASRSDREPGEMQQCPSAEVLAHEVEFENYPQGANRPELPKTEWRDILNEIYNKAMWETNLTKVKDPATKWWEYIVLELRRAERRCPESFPTTCACMTLLYLLNWFSHDDSARNASQYKAGTHAHSGEMAREKQDAFRLRKMMVRFSHTESSLLSLTHSHLDLQKHYYPAELVVKAILNPV